MFYREVQPSFAVAPWVECYWRLQRGPSSWQSIYPDGCSELILHVTGASAELRGGRIVRRPGHFVHGATDRRILVRSEAETSVLAIRLRPWAVRALLGAPAEELAGQAVELEALEPALARRLLPIVEDPRSPGSQEAELDGALADWIEQRSPELPPTARVARYLLAHPTSTAGDVGRLTGWSARTVQRRFREEIGLPPKRFLQVARFLRFLRLLDLEPTAPLAQLAVAAGYYDQPHLHRDVRRFTGATPARLRGSDRSAFDSLFGRDRLRRLVVV